MANIDYDDFKGKLGVGRVHSGSVKKGQTVGLGRPGGDVKTGKISELFVFDNLGRMVRTPKSRQLGMLAMVLPTAPKPFQAKSNTQKHCRVQQAGACPQSKIKYEV